MGPVTVTSAGHLGLSFICPIRLERQSFLRQHLSGGWEPAGHNKKGRGFAMSLKFKFNGSVEEVVNLLTDPDFLVDRNTALGDLDCDCEVDEYDDEFIINVSRKMPVELSPFLARFFDPVQSMNLKEVWTRKGDGWRGSYVLNIVGQPITVTAEFSLVPDGSGSQYEIKHGCKAGIPLVGGKIEKTVLSQTADGARKELEYARQRLG